jgi:hypothetical protein
MSLDEKLNSHSLHKQNVTPLFCQKRRAQHEIKESLQRKNK